MWQRNIEIPIMTFQGVLLLKKLYEESKSEGIYAFLQTEDDTLYQLYRPDIYPADDALFFSFENQNVEIVGELERGEFIAVQSIKPIDITEESEL